MLGKLGRIDGDPVLRETRIWYQATAAERCLLWWGAEVVMVNVEAMRWLGMVGPT